NSPETPLFDKGRNLYNIGPARAAVAKGAALIVTEGYMDVIALVRAGFGGAVAPLGTAITEDQLRLMWRIAPEPVIMLDGDAAGRRAAMRLIDMALPMTGPGQALRFAVLPAGLDPDDLIRDQGTGAMAQVLDGARPLVDLLWTRETEGRVFDSPERRAALDAALRAAIARIPDESTRGHYADEIRRKRRALFGGFGGADQRLPFRARRGAPAAPLAPTRASVFVAQDAGDAILEGAVLLICAGHPELALRIESRLERMTPADGGRAALIHDLLAGTDSAAGRAALNVLRDDAYLALIAAARPDSDPDEAQAILENALDRLESRRAGRAELARAEIEITGEADEGLTWRMSQMARARHRADHPEISDTSDLGEDREALAARLRAWVDGEIWRKG
ncbi:MAG: toprim domain-containing protein, partial [Paracoccus sp. (in: a-proteobacteria)]|nr:toprim domain-containing protein [Paracoccus sp. (in: a-proteobacteria)]